MFTDCIGIDPKKGIHIAKVSSAPLAPLVCMRKILQLRGPDLFTLRIQKPEVLHSQVTGVFYISDYFKNTAIFN